MRRIFEQLIVKLTFYIIPIFMDIWPFLHQPRNRVRKMWRTTSFSLFFVFFSSQTSFKISKVLYTVSSSNISIHYLKEESLEKYWEGKIIKILRSGTGRGAPHADPPPSSPARFFRTVHLSPIVS